MERLEGLPEFAESLARDLPHLLDRAPAIRDYETIPEERSEDNPLGAYILTPDRIRHLPEEEVAQRERQTEDEKAARYRGMYEDLGLKVIAHPDGTLEAGWRFGEAVLRNGSDTSLSIQRVAMVRKAGVAVPLLRRLPDCILARLRQYPSRAFACHDQPGPCYGIAARFLRPR